MERPRWQWVSPGALFATALWIIGSVLFSLYVSRFASYNATYGSAAAVHTTAGTAKPMGERGAFAANTVGEAS